MQRSGQSLSFVSLAVGLLVGATIGYLLGSSGTTGAAKVGTESNSIVTSQTRQESPLTQHNRSGAKNTFFLGVMIKFPSVDDKEKFKRIFAPVAEHVTTSEPTTTSYELSESDQDPQRVFILERYKDKDAYLKIHKSSAPFLKFKDEFQVLRDAGAEVDGHSYLESGIGFV